MHIIYPVKHVLERLKKKDYSCDFCKGENETIFHLFFHCTHTTIFWIDVKLFIKKMLDISLQLSGFNVIIYFADHGFDKYRAYFIQLLILIGKFHI